jgi:MGT family glycosyltransferase
MFSAYPSGRSVFMAILEALRDEPLNLIMTVGPATDASQFGLQPPNVHVEQFIPQQVLLPHCDVVVHHGGFNTTIGALDAGLPMVILPLGADQPANAASCAALGVALVLDQSARRPDAIRTAVRSVLVDGDYARHAQRVRDALDGLPGPEHAVSLLERLAQEKQPLVGTATL